MRTAQLDPKARDIDCAVKRDNVIGARLDVSVKETALCIVDEAGKICREVKVVNHPEDLLYSVD